MEDKYYVYFHRRLDNNQVFYVGMGNGYRLKAKSNRNRYWKNIVKKHGYIVEKIEVNLPQEAAKNREIYWIKHFGRLDLKTGNLVNMTMGGDGVHVLNELALKKLKSRGKKDKEILKKDNPPYKPEIPVVAINFRTKEIIKEFKSISEAAKTHQITINSISKCCKGEMLFAGVINKFSGFIKSCHSSNVQWGNYNEYEDLIIWEYKDENLKNKYINKKNDLLIQRNNFL